MLLLRHSSGISSDTLHELMLKPHIFCKRFGPTLTLLSVVGPILILALTGCGPSDEELAQLIDQRARAIVGAVPTATPQLIPTPLPTATPQPTATRIPEPTLVSTATLVPTATSCANRHCNSAGHTATDGDTDSFSTHGYTGANPYSGYFSSYGHPGHDSQHAYAPAHSHAPAGNRLQGHSPARLAFSFHDRYQIQPRVRVAD